MEAVRKVAEDDWVLKFRNGSSKQPGGNGADVLGDW